MNGAENALSSNCRVHVEAANLDHDLVRLPENTLLVSSLYLIHIPHKFHKSSKPVTVIIKIQPCVAMLDNLQHMSTLEFVLNGIIDLIHDNFSCCCMGIVKRHHPARTSIRCRIQLPHHCYAYVYCSSLILWHVRYTEEVKVMV